MFGSMETWAASQSPEVIEAIVPTVVFPFVLIGALLSSLVTAVAGLFGVNWKTEAPAKILKWMLQPRIVVGAVAFNLAIFGGMAGYRQVSDRSKPLWLVQFRNDRMAIPSSRTYADTWELEARLTEKTKPDTKVLEAVWKTKLPSGSFRGLIASGESVFTGSDDGYVYELDRKSGEIIRKFYVGTSATPLPVIWNGTLFAGEGIHTTRHARVYAFDLKSGKLRGAVQTKGHTEGDLVLAHHNGRALLFAAAGGDGLYAIDAETLNIVWHAPISHFDSGVLVSGNRVYAATGMDKDELTASSTLWSLSLETGKTEWKTELAASGWSRPVQFGNSVCVGLGEIYLDRNYGQLACYNTADGKSTLSVNLESPILNTPLRLAGLSGTKFLVAGLDGRVCRIDMERASLDWCTEPEMKSQLYASAAIAGDKILVPSDEGLRVLDADSGALIQTWTPDGETWALHYAGLTVEGDEWFMIDLHGLARKMTVR